MTARISATPLPAGCIQLRLHPDETGAYIAHSIIKPLNKAECELVGLNFPGITIEIVRMALVECAKAGYDHCYIERRKGDKITRKRFCLDRYK